MADPRGDVTGLVMRHFTLSPTKDDAYGRASREALRAYALLIVETNPRLAGDLTAWVGEIEVEHGKSR